jgi:hypothetical protein
MLLYKMIISIMINYISLDLVFFYWIKTIKASICEYERFLRKKKFKIMVKRRKNYLIINMF